MKSLRIQNFLFSFSPENVFLSFSDADISAAQASDSNQFRQCREQLCHLRFYQTLTTFGSLTTFFTPEDLFAWEEKKVRNCLGPRNVYFKVSHVLKTTRDVKTLLNTIKSPKRFKKVNLKASHWKLYWHEAQYCQKITPPWKTDVSSKYLVRFRKTFLFSVMLSFIKLDFIVIYSIFFENDQTVIKADEYCCQTSGLPTVTFFDSHVTWKPYWLMCMYHFP